jgi:hypothetical protein
MKPDVVTVIRGTASLRLMLAQANGGAVGAPAEIDDLLAALTGDLAATGVAERLEEPPIEAEAPLRLRRRRDRRDRFPRSPKPTSARRAAG